MSNFGNLTSLEKPENEVNDDNNTSKSNDKCKILDPLDATVGQMGRWQIIICSALGLLKLPLIFHMLGIIFLAPPVSFQCTNPNGEEKQCFSNCTIYEFHSPIFNNTIVIEWNLICEREWMKNMTQTIFMFGVLLGNILFGVISDRYGRRRPLILAVIVQTVTGVLASFAWDWYSFTFVRFILAIFCGGSMITGFVITTEMVGIKYRQLFSMIFQIPINIGQAVMVGIAYLTQDSWSKFQMWISAPTIILISYFWLVPESPRWLITMGKTSKAINILKKGAKTNKLQDENVEKIINDYQQKIVVAPKENMFSLFRTPNIRRRTIFLCFAWLSSGICFFGVSQYIGQLFGNIFINVLTSALIQIPGVVFAIFLNNWFGRKKTLIGAYILSGVPLLTIAFIPENYKMTIVGFALVGIMGCSMNFSTIYLYAAEIFPTVLRNTGMGLCSVLARCGSMIAPFVAGLDSFHYWIPSAIFGIMPLIAAVLIILLPETHGKNVPDTVEEAENFQDNESRS